MYFFKLSAFWHLFEKYKCFNKAELPQEDFFFALNFLPWKFLLIKKLEIEKTKTTFIIPVLKVLHQMVLVFFDF